MQVVRGRRVEVKRAELEIKRLLPVVGPIAGLPLTFGRGTEVVPRRTRIDLLTFLPGGEDVTAALRDPGGPLS